MYKPLALSTGAIIGLMILSNGIMVEYIGNTPALWINHITGLTTALIIFILTKTKWQSFKGIPVFYLLAGITGLITVGFTNIAFLALGATVTLMLSMVGRLVTSIIVDHFGLMGMKRYPFQPAKIFGLILMVAGTILIVIS